MLPQTLFYTILGQRLRNFKVLVGRSLCAVFKGKAKTGQQIVLPCGKPLRGRKVKITLRGIEYLSLAEVQVIGVKRKIIKLNKM